jgi:hypothetical protein
MQLVYHWCNKVEVYSPTLHYTEGPHDFLAENLSRLHRLVTPAQITEGKSPVEPAEVSNDDNDVYFLDQEYSCLNDDDIWEMLECYLNLTEIPCPDCNPLNYTHIHER